MLQSTESVACKFQYNWINDGYCDDGGNTIECDFDGGDCCGPDVNTTYCSLCQCLEDHGGGENNFTTTIKPCNFHSLHWIGDGYCDDDANNLECNFDGGDCCGDDAITDYCLECQCLELNYTTEKANTTTDLKEHGNVQETTTDVFNST